MKIGIMTFHWGANYGAVLQVYALANFLQKEYQADVEVIDYYPENLTFSYMNAIKQIKPGAILRKIKEIQKNKIITPFRKKLPLSKRYYTNDELMRAQLDYDVIITGSDQIWNPFFLFHGENKVTPVYYLNFANNDTKKISVSASFGCHKLPVACNEIVIPLLKRFHSISVREKTGVDILSLLGFDEVTLTADPTALLSKEMYMELCAPDHGVKPGSVSRFILRKQTSDTNKLIKAISGACSKERTVDIDFLPVSNWLAAIRDSDLVITNSFHCVMMCLKLHTPFAVVLESGGYEGMNDRFTTLLETFQLSDRIVRDAQDIKKLSGGIDFDKVDEIMEQYSETLKVFLKENLS